MPVQTKNNRLKQIPEGFDSLVRSLLLLGLVEILISSNLRRRNSEKTDVSLRGIGSEHFGLGLNPTEEPVGSGYEFKWTRPDRRYDQVHDGKGGREMWNHMRWIFIKMDES